MSPRIALSLALVCVVCAAGCRQPDGASPVAEADVPNRIVDLGRNLDNIAAGDPAGAQDLAADLKVFIPDKPAAAAPIDDLSRAVAQALSGRRLDAEASRAFAQQLWLTVASTNLSDKQAESLQADVRKAALATGMAPEVAAAVATQAATVQRAASGRQRRWYEVF